MRSRSGSPRQPQVPWLLRRRVRITVAAGLAGIGAAVLAGSASREDVPIVAALLAPVVGWSYIASGLALARHRPRNRLGAVLVFIGFGWLATFIADADWPPAFTLGTAVEDLYLVGFVYLVLSFPSGRLERTVDRWLFGAALVLSTVVELAFLVFADPPAVFCDRCPANLLQIARHDSLSRALLDGQRVTGVVLCLVTLGVLVERWRRASAPARRSSAPVLWTGSATFAALAFAVANDTFGEPLGAAPNLMRYLTFASIALAVVAVLLHERLARGAVAELIIELEGTGEADLRAALARTLGDPSLDLLFWAPRSGGYVDATGRSVAPPHALDGRAVTFVERDGRPVAALVHDSALQGNHDLIDSACAAAALALEKARLEAELRGRVSELHASRARLVEATAAERRRIERDLHDGAQVRLMSIAMSLALAESRLEDSPGAARPALREARAGLKVALEELRELSQGVHPSVLVERGLATALEELARSAPLPVSTDIALAEEPPEHIASTAYFVVSEALANAGKHAHAGSCLLSVHDDSSRLFVALSDDGVGGASTGGSGLTGLVDRVEAVGGRLSISSPAGHGTSIRAELPCE